MKQVRVDKFAGFITGNLTPIVFLWLCIALSVGLTAAIGEFWRPIRLVVGLIEGFFPAVALVWIAALPSLCTHTKTGTTVGRALLVAFCILAWLMLVLDSAVTAFAGCRINESVLRIILQSDAGEAGEFMAHLPLGKKLPILLPWLLLPFAAFAIKARKRVVSTSVKYLILTAFIGSAVAFIFFQARGIINNDTVIGGRVTPLQVYMSYSNLEGNAEHIANLGEALRANDAGVADSCSTTVVVVIGESDNKAHSSLYGYTLPTWHHLDSLRCNSSDTTGLLIPFADAVTGDGWTMYAMRNLFTMGSDSTLWSKRPLWPALIRKAGLRMEYYDNQSEQRTANSDEFSCLFFVNDASISDQCFDYRNDRIFDYDGALLDRYLPQAATSPEHSVILFHLMGQHFSFDKRYPSDRSRFTTADYSFRPDLSAPEKEETSHYDNATAYLDENLYRIIKAFDDRDAVIVYTPDHGELAYDYAHKSHREIAELTPGYARAIYSIPFVVYMTRAFIDAHPAKAQAIMANSSRRIRSYDLGYLIVDIAGVSTPAWDATRSVASSHYKEPAARLIDECRYDFDTLMSARCDMQ